MNKFFNLFTAALFVSLTIFVSCGGDDGPDTPPCDALCAAANLLTTGTATATSVTLDDNDITAEWSNFTMVWTGDQNGGTYTVTGVPAGSEAVFADPKTWTFNNNSATSILRGDGVVVTISVSETQLVMNFTIDTSSGRTQGIDGAYRFTADKS